MVSYVSLVLSFLLLVGPLMILNAVAPNLVGPWAVSMLLVSALFVMWVATQAHEAYTRYRFALSLEETKNISFFGEEVQADIADPEPVTRPIEVQEDTGRRPRTATVAHGSPVA